MKICLICRGPRFDPTKYIDAEILEKGVCTSSPTMNIVCNKLNARWVNKATLVKKIA